MSNPNPKIYLIADTHFGHTNIIRYSNRPFNTVEEMDAELIKRWNETVRPIDKVFMLGDFTMRPSKQYLASLVAQLSGKISLVMGNHDVLRVKDYYEAGFDYVSRYPIVIHKFIILSHAPLFVTNNLPYFNIYGHVHNNPNYKTKSSSGWCVSVERQDYRPVELKLEDIAQLAMDGQEQG